MIIYHSGFNCKKCTEINKQNKMIKSMLQKYGVKNISQSEVIKNKKIKTYIITNFIF